MGALDGRTALVTGSSKNIGRAIALRLAADGADVAVHYHGDGDAAAGTVEQVTDTGGRSAAFQADISDRDEVARLFDEVRGRLGDPHVLVCNAGYIRPQPVAEATPDSFDRTFAVNARGTFFCLQEAARRMDEGGRIVCTASSNTEVPQPGQAAYTGSKLAVVGFVRTLAQELGPRGITVNAVSPGPTETTMLNAAVTEEQKEGMRQMSPLGRLGRPEDVAELVAFLASDGGGWLTGQNLQVGGGFAMT